MAEYCSDQFILIEDADDSYRMWQGLVGPHYTPVMSNDGTLSWTNNGNLPNPDSVNLSGPQGAGIRIAGIVPTAEQLPPSAPAGDIWLVGEESPYEGYSYVGESWIDLGELTVGPAGPPGPQGDDYVLTEEDKAEIAATAETLLLTLLGDNPLPITKGGTGAGTVEDAKTNLGIDAIETKVGSTPLSTTAQDLSGAINELAAEIGDAEFDTTAQNATDAINELNGEISALETQNGNAVLETTAQTLSGAVNELNSDITTLESYEALHLSVASFSSFPKTVSNAAIKANMRVIECVFGTPSAVVSDVTWTTADGSLTLAGTMASSGSTTAEITLIRTN